MTAVCVTESCKYYSKCARSAINVDGTNLAVSYGTEGSGHVVSCYDGYYSVVEETYCGEHGRYKMFISKD